MTSRSKLFDVDEDGKTELMKLAAEGDFSAVEKMIFSLMGTGIYCERYALIRKKDSRGQTAITIARDAGHDNVAELLRKEHDRMYWYE